MSDTRRPTRILRAKHDDENPYFLYSRVTAQDETISWEARGVLSYLFSKPDDWIVQVSDLQQGCGRDKVYSILKELRERGYLTVEDRPKKKGKYTGIDYVLHEHPVKPLTDFQEAAENPKSADLPDTVQPDTAKPEHTYNRNTQKTESTKSSAPNGAGAIASPEPSNPQSNDGQSLTDESVLTSEEESQSPPSFVQPPITAPLVAAASAKSKAPPAVNPTWTTEVKDAMAKLCKKDWLIEKHAIGMGGALSQISKREPVTLELLRRFYTNWHKCDWRGLKGQPPKPHEVVEVWVALTESDECQEQHGHANGRTILGFGAKRPLTKEDYGW